MLLRKHPLPLRCSQFRVSISSWYSRHFTACCHLSCSHLILPAKTYLVYPPLGTHLNCTFPSTCSSRPASAPSHPPTPSWALCFGTCCLALLNAVCAQLVFPTPRAGQLAQCSTGCVLGKAVLSGFVLPDALLSSTVSGWIPHRPLQTDGHLGTGSCPPPEKAHSTTGQF